MKLSVSNIAWEAKDDNLVYGWMKEMGVKGLEIAPTRIFADAPYTHLREGKVWAENLKKQYGFSVSSMQSIWYGRKENLFSLGKEQEVLREYTMAAIDFAQAVGCGNLVFGCPRNRNMPDTGNKDQAISFFQVLGEYAESRDTVLSLEPNPPIYHTNFINTTEEALSFLKSMVSPGLGLNLDLGTMIENQESVSMLEGNVEWIRHVHISEPNLVPVVPREIHRELCKVLKKEGYSGYVSLEMGKQQDIKVLKDVMEYVRSVFF